MIMRSMSEEVPIVTLIECFPILPKNVNSSNMEQKLKYLLLHINTLKHT